MKQGVTLGKTGKQNVSYDYIDLDEIVLAYAVIIPILMQHYILLQRNLIYTGVTRGEKLVVIVGTKKALAIAVRNDKTQKRYTYLKNRLT